MACIFSPADKRFVSRREHALQVAQPQESQHGVWRTYCDGSRVIPCKVTAHPMGCDDNRGEESMELLKAFKSLLKPVSIYRDPPLSSFQRNSLFNTNP